jgi:hypothetical protein
MKILLDESIDIRFKKSFPSEYKVYTVREMKWTGVKNGKLIELLNQNEFDYWIVVDKNIPYQQNIDKISFTIIVLDIFRNTLKQLEAILPEILLVFKQISSEKIIFIKEAK